MSSSTGTTSRERLSLAARNAVFTLVVPATGAVYVPWWILTSGGARSPRLSSWPAVVIVAAGVALYAWCLWEFARTGQGTPGPWDPPRRFVAVGPYRYVRNPMYISAGLVVGGEAVLFGSVSLAVYLVAVALLVHLFVKLYEEPTLRRLFGADYEAYLNSVWRWVPRPPRRA